MKTSFILGLSLIAILLSACTEETIINNYYTASPLDSNWQKTKGPYVANSQYLYYSFDGAIYVGSGSTNSYYKTTDEGENWTTVDFDTSMYFFSAKKSKDSNFYAMDRKLGLFKSIDGINWTKISHPLIDVNGSYDFYYNSYNVLDNGDLMLGISRASRGDSGYYKSYGELYRSTDGGTNWSLVKNGSDSLNNVYYLKLAANGYLYVYQAVNKGNRESILLLSTDNGFNWKATGTEHFDNQEKFYSLPDGTIFLLSAYGLYRSDDFGKTFVLKNKGIYGAMGDIFLESNNYFYCYTSYGIYRSTDKGDNWETLLEDVGQIIHFCRSNSGHLYFVLNSYVIYRTKKANMY